MRILDIVSVIILILVAVLGVLYWQVKGARNEEIYNCFTSECNFALGN